MQLHGPSNKPLEITAALAKNVQILCRKTEEALKPRPFGIRPTLMRLRLRCAITLEPGPARTFTVRTLTSVDHYAEGMGNYYVADDLAGCRRERLTTKQLSVIQWYTSQPRLTPGAAVFRPLKRACVRITQTGVGLDPVMTGTPQLSTTYNRL